MLDEYGSTRASTRSRPRARVRAHTHTHAHTRKEVHEHANTQTINSIFIASSQQQWFRECASLLRDTYIACIVPSNGSTLRFL